MIDEEISSLLEDAGYRFVAPSARYQVVEGAASRDGFAGSADEGAAHRRRR